MIGNTEILKRVVSNELTAAIQRIARESGVAPDDIYAFFGTSHDDLVDNIWECVLGEIDIALIHDVVEVYLEELMSGNKGWAEEEE